MKFNWFRSHAALVAAALATTGFFTNLAVAKERHNTAGYRVITEETLGNGQTTDLFLLKDQRGKKFLYLASANGTLSIFDVSYPNEVRQVSSWVLASGGSGGFHVRPINDQFVVATRARNTEDSLAVLDPSNAPSKQIAEQLKNVDAYAIDGDNQVLYVAQRGKLIVMRFDGPITRQAEIWEESYEAR
jgi:hypothetical protein